MVYIMDLDGKGSVKLSTAFYSTEKQKSDGCRSTARTSYASVAAGRKSFYVFSEI